MEGRGGKGKERGERCFCCVHYLGLEVPEVEHAEDHGQEEDALHGTVDGSVVRE